MNRHVLVVGDRLALPGGDDVWRIVTVAGPDDALARLDAGDACDAVVCAGLNPTTTLDLLSRLRDDYPDVARLLLSSPAGMGVALRTADLAHQVLPDRSDHAAVLEVLDRTLSVRDLLTSEPIRRLAGSTDGLPSLPRVFSELTRALESPNCGAAEIAVVVRRDPALAAKVLQLVNSSFFGLGRRITEVGEAVAYLGVAMVRSLVLSTEAMSLFRAPATSAGIDVDDLQAKAIATATLASRIAPKGAGPDAFAAGLLQDIGVLLLAAKAPELLATPEEEWGFTHDEVGAYLLGLWGLPGSVVEAVAHHHDAFAVRHRTFEVMDAVFLARVVAEGPVLDAAPVSYLSALDGLTVAAAEILEPQPVAATPPPG